MNAYTKEIIVNSYRGYILFRVEERPLIDPLFDTDPLVKIEMLDDQKGWVDVTNVFTDKQKEPVYHAWDIAYQKEFADTEETCPMYIPGPI